MDYNKMTARQAKASGVYDGWHEASFVLIYDRPSVRPAPEFSDRKKAQRYAEGIQLGMQRHNADLEVNGKPVAPEAVAINAQLRARKAAVR